MSIENLSIQNLSDFCQKNNTQAIIIPDSDFFLNEYTPKEDNIRFQLTKFKGSVGQSFYLNGKLYLVVDGRYRLAAKEQFQGDELIIVDYTKQIWPKVLETIRGANISKIGVWKDRMDVANFSSLNEEFNVIDCREIYFSELNYPEPKHVKNVKAVELNLNDNEIFLTHQVDVISRLLGVRTDALSYMSSMPGLLFYSKNKKFLFHPFKSIQLSNVDHDYHAFLFDHSKLSGFDTFNFVMDPLVTNQYVLDQIKQNFPSAKIILKEGFAAQYMSFKPDWELIEFSKSFASSDKAVWRTLNYLKANQEKNLSEVDLKQKITDEYFAHGAWNLSFHPICGFGANSAIIHYGEPSQSKSWEEGEFFLMDSGAYFDYGIATDTTRTIVRGRPSDKQIKCYSLVLRGLIRSMSAVFPNGTIGSQIDMLARDALFQAGLNYQHGTGHGIGVHVHESGYLVNPFSTVELRAGQVGSLEPGYYEEGWGGIRLENAVKVVEHPEYDGYLTFESLCYIPFEEELIDRNLFTGQELEYLDQYQEKSKNLLNA